MSDLIHRAQKAKTLIGDPSLPDWQRFSEGLECLSGLMLSDLVSPVKEGLEADLASVNRLLTQFGVNEEADYAKVDEAGWRQLLNELDEAVSRAIALESDRIAADLDVGRDRLPVEAMRETREHRDVMIPRLIESIQEATLLARDEEPPEGNVHFLAVFLLTEFRVEEAFPVMLEAFSLPGELPFELFGDAVTSTLARILALFAGDRPELMESMIRNRELNEFVRWEAAQSFLHLVRDGRLTREEAVARLQNCLRHAIDQKDIAIIAELICVLNDYAPKEAMDVIREAYEKDLVEAYMIDIEDVEESIANGEEKIQSELERCPPTEIDDAIKELSNWASFSKKPAPPPAPKARPSPLPRPSRPPYPTTANPTRPATVVRPSPKVGRNAPCPCGSGKKYKKCCGSRK